MNSSFSIFQSRPRMDSISCLLLYAVFQSQRTETLKKIALTQTWNEWLLGLRDVLLQTEHPELLYSSYTTMMSVFIKEQRVIFSIYKLL